MKKLYLLLAAVIIFSLLGSSFLSHQKRELIRQEDAKVHEIMQSLTHEEIDKISDVAQKEWEKKYHALLEQWRAEDRARGYKQKKPPRVLTPEENIRNHQLAKELGLPVHVLHPPKPLSPQERLAQMPMYERYAIEDYLKENDATCKILHEKIVTIRAIDRWTRNIFPCSVFAFPVVLLLHFLFFTYHKFRHGTTTKQQRLGLVILTTSFPIFLLSVLLFDESYFRPMQDLQWGYTYAWVFLAASIFFFLGVGFILPVFQTILDLGKKIHSWVNKGD